MLTRISFLLAALVVSGSGFAQSGGVVPDFDYFMNEVQPIFLAKREGNVRCIQCHYRSSNFRLQTLEEGEFFWTEEQSRMNYESALTMVLPGEDPLNSRLLTHALARDAGGDPFHGGGTHFRSQDDAEWRIMADWVAGATERREPAELAVRIIQTNAAGDDSHVIDPETNEVIGRITDIEIPHGIVGAPDGSKVYVGIMEMPGSVDIIDVASMKLVKTLPVEGAIHNIYVTPDSKHAVAGSIQRSMINVIDTATDELAWTLEMSSGIRPMAFNANPDGSTKNIFVQLSGFHGFAVVDFATRREVARVEHPPVEGEEAHYDGLQGAPAHGLGVSPDGSTVWSTSKVYSHVYIHSLPDLEEIGQVFVGQHPEWVTFTPDGKTAYMGAAGDHVTYAVDVESMEVVAVIPVGQVPKRVAMVRMAVDE